MGKHTMILYQVLEFDKFPKIKLNKGFYLGWLYILLFTKHDIETDIFSIFVPEASCLFGLFILIKSTINQYNMSKAFLMKAKQHLLELIRKSYYKNGLLFGVNNSNLNDSENINDYFMILNASISKKGDFRAFQEKIKKFI